MRSASVSRLLGLLPCAIAATLLWPLTAQAASLRVLVVDSRGAPLPDAVVTLEPVVGRLPVKPMPQVDIAQSRKQFDPQLTVITVGTAVNFPNFDSVRHQVYSFSPIKSFELKLYTGVPSAPVVFDKPGVAVLGCNIHDNMTAWVVVVDTPHHGRTQAAGEVRLEGIAPGTYRLRGWHANVPEGLAPAPQNITVTAGDLAARILLPAAAP